MIRPDSSFEFIYSLDDTILIQGIELLFKYYNMNDDLKMLYELRKKHNYLIQRVITNDKTTISYRSLDDYNLKLPYILITNNFIIKPTFTLFFWPTKLSYRNPHIRKYDIFHDICIKLNRNLIINNVLAC
jgi:hypothetical protein